MKYYSKDILSSFIVSQGDRNKALSPTDLGVLLTSPKTSDEGLRKESLEHSLGKISTKLVTGEIGAQYAQVLASYISRREKLSLEEVYDLQSLLQFPVQFKNIGKRGLWYDDSVYTEAHSIASKYGIEKSIDNAMKKVLGVDTPIYSLEPKVSKEDIFSSKNKTNESEVIVKDFDFSDL